MADDDRASSTLTAAERQRIREEMLLREELHRELSAVSGWRGRAGVIDLLKSPLVVTVVGGLFLSFFGGMTAHFERRQTRERVLLEKRIAIVSNLRQDIDNVVSIDASLHKQRLWLLDPANKSDDARNDVGLRREDVQKLYLELWKMFVHARKPAAILAEVRFFFSTPVVGGLIDEEAKALQAIKAAKTSDEIYAASGREAEGLHRLEHELEKEIERTTR